MEPTLQYTACSQSNEDEREWSSFGRELQLGVRGRNTSPKKEDEVGSNIRVRQKYARPAKADC